MSELREELLGGGINKKKIIAIALVAILLVAAFAFSTVLFSFLFGTQRPYPSREKADTDYEDADLIKPPYPFDEDFWQDLLDQVDDPSSLLDMLSEMFDGDIDDLDLGNFSQGLLDLLFSGAGEKEVFRVYNYLSFANMSDVLWKYECFDEYTGEGWISNAGTNIYNFYSYGDYLLYYNPDPELLKIRMPLSPDSGINSMVIPTLFPTPFVIDGSFGLDPGTPNSLNPGSLTLYKDEYNSTTIDLSFSTDDDVNMTFNMFGYYNYLPTPAFLNSSAVVVTAPSPEYLSLQNYYLQLPPTIEIYKTNNPYFNSHFNILDGIINPNDNAFWAANKIRNYLQTHFSFPLSPSLYNPAPDGTDIVEWFCETEQGLWSDFASAFIAFARAFGISSRFVDGFNSYSIEEIEDPREPSGANNTFAIKYKNLYNWAEIYIPTGIDGDGQWVQFDIFDTFGGAGNPIIGGNYNITVVTDQPVYTRPDIATITATVKNNTATDPIDGLTITFTDLTTGQDLGQNITDINGETSVQFPINNSHVVGPHIIQASYDLFNAGYNVTSIFGDISVVLTNVNPGEINISDALPDSTNIQGYVSDPLNGERVEDAQVNIILLQKGTNNDVPNAFNPPSIVTDANGVFGDILNLDISVPAGQYEIRADFNETWIKNIPYIPFPIPITIPGVTNSSDRIEFNVTKTLDVWFYIDGIPSNYPNFPPFYPTVSRYHNLSLVAKVVSVTSGPIPNKIVSFYDYSRGNIMIGSDISDANGVASINYIVGDYSVAGPNLLFARIGLQENYSYFVLNEQPTINIISGPTPRVINRTGGGATQFNIIGEIFDSTNNSLPLSYSKITLTLLKSGVNYSSYLVPSESYPYQTDSTGTFDLTFGVLPNTPPGNYTLRLDFNGTIYFDLGGLPYGYEFTIPSLSTFAYIINDLQIDAPATLQFSFWINGTTSDNTYNPVINRGDPLNLSVSIRYGGSPIDDGEWVYFYDVTQDNLFIGADQTNSGYAEVIYSTGGSTTAGPHLIYATWNNKYNYSYFILDAPIEVTLDICPQPRDVNRSGAIGRNFLIQGYINDSSNWNPIKYGEIDVYLYDGPIDVSFYLNLVSGSLQLGPSGEIDLVYSVLSSTPAKNYTLIVAFDGSFIYTNPNYPQSFDLWYIGNFNDATLGLHDLRVIDPDDVDIFFFIEGKPTQTFYTDGNPPERFNAGDSINFSVYITQGGLPATGTVSFTDIYTGDPLGSPSLIGGFASVSVNTTSWHAGLHRIRAQWSGSASFNTTYVIINETINIFSYINPISIQRDVDNFIVSGTVRESGEFLRGLRLNITLLDDTFTDVSGLYLIGARTITINIDGSYQFSNSIHLSCPQGDYYIRIDFNGSINAPGIFMNDYMVHNSSLPISIDITAGTYVIGNYDTKYYKAGFFEDDELWVYGTLYWDNGTWITGKEINVTIRDNTGAILATTTVTTNSVGFFNATFTVGLWDEAETEVWVYFYPEDNFGFPESSYIILTEQIFFREP